MTGLVTDQEGIKLLGLGTGLFGVGAVISTSTVLCIFLANKRFRKYPVDLLLYVMVCEGTLNFFLIANLFFGQAISKLAFKHRMDGIVYGLVQVFPVAMYGWLLASMLCLLMTFYRPFTKPTTYYPIFHILVWGISFFVFAYSAVGSFIWPADAKHHTSVLSARYEISIMSLGVMLLESLIAYLIVIVMLCKMARGLTATISRLRYRMYWQCGLLVLYTAVLITKIVHEEYVLDHKELSPFVKTLPGLLVSLFCFMKGYLCSAFVLREMYILRTRNHMSNGDLEQFLLEEGDASPIEDGNGVDEEDGDGNWDEYFEGDEEYIDSSLSSLGKPKGFFSLSKTSDSTSETSSQSKSILIPNEGPWCITPMDEYRSVVLTLVFRGILELGILRMVNMMDAKEACKPYRVKFEWSKMKNFRVNHPISARIRIFGFYAFVDLCTMWGINARQILEEMVDFSLNAETNIDQGHETEGKGGGFFCFSKTKKFIVKTITRSEAKVFEQILPKYHAYMMKNPGSHICRFIGLYNMISNMSSIYFVVMANGFNGHAMDLRFDMKGSWVNRSAVNGSDLYLDNDFDSMGMKLFLSPDQSCRLVSTLESDSKFLESQKIMDYSLLLGVSRQAGMEDSMEHNRYNALSNHKGDEIYYVTIIDIFTKYDFMKQSERLMKVVTVKDKTGISSIEPHAYSARFISAMKSRFG